MVKPLSGDAACASCGSTRIVSAQCIGSGHTAVTVDVKVPDGGRLYLVKSSPTVAEVCSDCGVVRLRATDVAQLRAEPEEGGAASSHRDRPKR